MGLRTSVYLDDDTAAAWKARGVPLGELVRRGLAERAPEEEAAQRAAELVRDEVRFAARALAVEAAQEALGAVDDEMQDRINRAVERAMRKM